MMMRALLPALLLVGAGVAVPQWMPGQPLPAGAPGVFAQHAVHSARAALPGLLDQIKVRRLEVVRVERSVAPCPYRAEVLARTWFGQPYATVTVDCQGATVLRN